MQRLRAMLESGVIRRIGAVPNHYAIGWTANGMTVWDVADDAASTNSAQRSAPSISSPTATAGRAPCRIWPYNLFAMVHGASRDAAPTPRAS
jgi:DNA-binding Lrp family transcriptional regulator